MNKFTRPKTCRKFLRDIVEQLPFPIYWKDRDSRYLGCNTLFAQHAGWNTPTDVIGKTDFEMRWKDVADLYQVEDQFMVTYGTPKLGCEEPEIMADGRMSWVRATKIPVHNAEQKILGVFGFHNDITELRQAKEAEQRLTRALALVTKSQAQLISSDTEAHFLANICKLLVEDGGYHMTWIGLQEDGGKGLRPVAQARIEPELPRNGLSDANANGDGPPLDLAPDDNQHAKQPYEELSYPVRPETQPNLGAGAGYLSGIAIPLTHKNELLGAINLYTNEISEFLDQEIRLLEELSRNIAFGIYCFRLRAKHPA